MSAAQDKLPKVFGPVQIPLQMSSGHVVRLTLDKRLQVLAQRVNPRELNFPPSASRRGYSQSSMTFRLGEYGPQRAPQHLQAARVVVVRQTQDECGAGVFNHASNGNEV
ncbi:MAG: hypothetical protein OXG24_13005 [Gammaproteobacteria bacterium]|nr:hypothetical protein [Gammaproteobacteria bacterium]